MKTFLVFLLPILIVGCTTAPMEPTQDGPIAGYTIPVSHCKRDFDPNTYPQSPYSGPYDTVKLVNEQGIHSLAPARFYPEPSALFWHPSPMDKGRYAPQSHNETGQSEFAAITVQGKTYSIPTAARFWLNGYNYRHYANHPPFQNTRIGRIEWIFRDGRWIPVRN